MNTLLRMKRKAYNMKRFAYTLAEALIALAIIAVIAAITLPMANKFMPDGTKVLYLKAYDSLMTMTQSIAANPQIYPTNNEGDPIIYKNYPLFNLKATTMDGVIYGGNRTKFCQLLAASFGDNAPNCSASYVENPAWNATNISFTANNGAEFMVFTDSAITQGNIAHYKTDVYIDTNGIERGNNCSFNEGSCKEPDRFKFEISSDGKVIASDIKGQEYIATRTNWRLYRDNDIRNDLGLTLAHLLDEDINKKIESEKPDLPPGQEYVDDIKAGDLFKTFSKGVYAEIHNPNMPAGDYTNQRHYYWKQDAYSWVELKGVYYVSPGEYTFDPYTGSDADEINTSMNNGLW